MAPQELASKSDHQAEFVRLIDDKKAHPDQTKAYYDLQGVSKLADELKAFYNIMRCRGIGETEAGDYALMFLQRSRGTSNAETMLQTLKLTRNEMAALAELGIAIQKKETFETRRANEFVVKASSKKQAGEAEDYARHFRESIAEHKENLVHYLAVSLKGGERTRENDKYFSKLHEVAERVFVNEPGAAGLMKKIQDMPGY